MPSISRTASTTALCLALAATATTAPAAFAAPPGSATASSTAAASTASTAWPTLRPGSHGVDVRTAQHLLREMGTLASPVGDSGVLVVDGRYGRDTTRAVKEFQRRYELPADGVIGARTWEALVVTVGRKSRNSAVMGVQLQLRALRYQVTADGRYGPQTTAAVTHFQRSARLRPDGITGRTTWRALLARTVG